MGIIDFFFRKPEVKKTESKEKAVDGHFDKEKSNKYIPYDSNESMRDYYTERLVMTKPFFTYTDIENPPEMFTTKFNFNKVLTANDPYYKTSYFLLSGDNARAFVKEMPHINEITQKAHDYIEGLPDFSIDKFTTIWEPIPISTNYFRYSPYWQASRFIIAPLTPGGKQKKYPIIIDYQDITGMKSGSFYFDKYGIVGKGRITVNNSDRESGICSYSLDFIDFKISHIWIHVGQNSEKKVLYNKNDKTEVEK